MGTKAIVRCDVFARWVTWDVCISTKTIVRLSSFFIRSFKETWNLYLLAWNNITSCSNTGSFVYNHHAKRPSYSYSFVKRFRISQPDFLVGISRTKSVSTRKIKPSAWIRMSDMMIVLVTSWNWWFLSIRKGAHYASLEPSTNAFFLHMSRRKRIGVENDLLVQCM